MRRILRLSARVRRAGHFSLLVHCAAGAARTAELAAQRRRAGCPESRKSPKESTFKQSIPRRTCTRTLRTDENSTQNSVVPGGPVFRFACNERSASGANDVSACGGRVVYGAFIPSRKTRAGPPGEALLSRCFLVTSLHQQRSDPLSEGQRKLCSGQQRSDPLGLRPSGSSGGRK